MLKDTTAILVDYADRAVLYKALNSLKRIDSRLHAIIVLHDWKMDPNIATDKITFVRVGSNDHGQLLNDIISKLNTSYVLFLHEMDYLSPAVSSDALKIPAAKTVLGTYYYNQDIAIPYPVLVRRSIFKTIPLPLYMQLPFKEALFSVWLSKVKTHQQVMEEGVVKQSRINRFATTVQKEKMIQKYQL